MLVLSDLRNSRNNLLALFNDPLASPEKMDSISAEYFSLIQGLFEVPTGNEQPSETPAEQSSNNPTKTKEGMTIKQYLYECLFQVFPRPAFLSAVSCENKHPLE